MINKDYFLYKKINVEHIALNCFKRKNEFVNNVKKKKVNIINKYVIYYVSFEFNINCDFYFFIFIIMIFI